MTTWTLPGVPDPLNVMLRRHWGARHVINRAWAKTCLVIMWRRRKPVTNRVRLGVTLYRKRRLDPDAKVASVKPILDAMVELGWLKDDSERWLELNVIQELARKTPPRVEIEWERIEDELQRSGKGDKT